MKITKKLLLSLMIAGTAVNATAPSLYVFAEESATTQTAEIDIRDTSSADYYDFLEYANGKVFDVYGNVSSATYVNWGHPYDGQCVSLIQAYLKYLGYPVKSRGNAGQWWTGRYSNGILEVCDIVETPQAGDIVVSGGNSSYGHIFIYHDANTAFSQNVDNSPYARLCEMSHQGAIIGYFRPKTQDGWKKDEKGIYYKENGKVVRNAWKKTDSGQHYLNEDGYFQTGFKEIDGNMYYFNSDGVMQTGWVKDNGNSYFMEASGAMAKGIKDIDGKTYYLKTDGALVTNGWYDTEKGLTYVKDGEPIKNDWLTIEKNKYHFDNNGILDINSTVSDGKLQLYDVKSGEKLSGWQTIDDNTYFFTDNGFITDAWQKEMGMSYYFDEKGHLCTGLTEIHGDTYYLNKNMAFGWQKIGNVMYYFGNDGKMAKGWQTIDLKVYYFGNDGKMRTGDVNIENVDYSFDDDGVMIHQTDNSFASLTK